MPVHRHLPKAILFSALLLFPVHQATARDAAYLQASNLPDNAAKTSSAIVQAQAGPPALPDPNTRSPISDTVSSQPGSATPEQSDDQFWHRDTLTGDWGGLRTTLQNTGIKLGLLEQSEIWGNMTGGLRRGVVYDGLTTASVSLDLDKLVGWTGATFFVNAYQIHGRGPSANLVGNQQIVSNIEATRDTKLYQLWLEQQLLEGRLTIRVGQEGASDQMMITQYGAVLLNSSFGFPGAGAADLPSAGPSYPLAVPFVRAQFQASKQFTVVGGVFSGDPAPPGVGDPQLRDRGGDAFRLDDHVLAVGEIWYSINGDEGATGLPGLYKLGAWYHSGHFQDRLLDTSGRSLASPDSTHLPRAHSTGFAVYGIVDQLIWRQPGSQDLGIGAFLLVMGAPSGFNLSNLFIETGLNWKGPFEHRENDIFALGVAYLGISPAERRFGSDVVAYTGAGTPYRSNETALEATYLYQVSPWLTLQPDVQVIVNPGANIPSIYSSQPLKNAVTAGVRASIVF